MATSASQQTAKTYAMGLVALVACFFTFAAQAQPTLRPNRVTTVELAATEAAVILTSLDLSYRGASWWKTRIKTDDRALDSPDEHVKEQALQNILFFATHYGDDADYRRATTDFTLRGNDPTLFNSTTTIPLDTPGQVPLSVYNLFGQKGVDLVDETQPGGVYRVTWDAPDAEGQRLAKGISLYRRTLDGSQSQANVTTLLNWAIDKIW